MMRMAAIAVVVLLASIVQTAAPPAIERRLYVTNKTGISVYDIDRGHAFIRKIDIPDSGDYPGIAASPQLEHLYVTSHTRDEVICLDLATDAVV
jgi:DNA-binding beta-propeller fold protein YncE